MRATRMFFAALTATLTLIGATTLAWTASSAQVLRDPTEAVLKKISQTQGEESVRTPKKQKTTAKSTHKWVVVIDAGHGGPDPGASGPDGTHEKDITLAVARALRDQLQASGKYRVIMTRDSDVFLKLSERVKVGQNTHADLFISLHADTVGNNPDTDTHGASIYTISDQASDQMSSRLAARENKADLIGGAAKSNSVVGNILLDLFSQETMTRSKSLADDILDGFEEAHIYMLERTHRSAGFAVLKGAEFPSTLIEMGFLSSPIDEPNLKNPSYRAHLAHAIATGVDGFFAEDKLTRNPL